MMGKMPGMMGQMGPMGQMGCGPEMMKKGMAMREQCMEMCRQMFAGTSGTAESSGSGSENKAGKEAGPAGAGGG
ncbi:MAG: hypothetical protein CVU89_10060 [Firmicutes bacterium HGW-Firmicutes-14]|nr:MAG: hypothetical protein CVU89_10060 [Firmicutes bacterium HGW-Firmicutes-14]